MALLFIPAVSPTDALMGMARDYDGAAAACLASFTVQEWCNLCLLAIRRRQQARDVGAQRPCSRHAHAQARLALYFCALDPARVVLPRGR